MIKIKRVKNSDLKDFNFKLHALERENEKLKKALQRIANIDYRPTKSVESMIAQQALKDLG